MPKDSRVYITGNNDALGNWNFMREMKMESTGNWTYSVPAGVGDTLQFKFTRGDWNTEAVDSNGVEYPNFVYVVKSDTTLTYKFSNWRDQVQHKIFITPERFANKAGYIELIEGWKYHTGDDTAWANPSFNDSSWGTINPILDKANFDKIKWTGNIWFRNHIFVDSSYWNKPFGLVFSNPGAAEIYLDGTLLYRIGKIGTSEETETKLIDRRPKYIVFGQGDEHVLAVRYANHSVEEMLKYNVQAGISVMIMDLNAMITQNVENVRSGTILQFVFSAFILAFAIMHILLFIFYPKAKENLFYSISLLGFAIVMYTSWQMSFEDTVFKIFTLTLINSLSVQTAMLFGLLTVYASSYAKMPKHYLVFVIISSLFALQTILFPDPDLIADYILYGYAVITILEMIRVVIMAVRKKDTPGWEWVIGAGFTIAMMFIAYQILISTGVIEQPLFGVRYVFVYGIVVLAVTVSINLSKKISDTNKNLEKQLIQVKDLSEKTIEQERKAREKELTRKILEADNERKTRELEEAHNLQMSMLPFTVPSIPGLDIAVYMKPATEVGGDYYDFKYNNNGELIIAVGDATGHGMKAGTMVATIKGLFTAENPDSDIVSFLNKSNSVIRNMHLGNIYMAMMLVKIDKNIAEITSAGMPPSLLYRKNSKSVEEIRLKALPLGGAAGFSYSKRETALNSGDTLLLMSDGFPELFNNQKEILDYAKAKEVFCSVAELPPDKVIDSLCSEAEQWRKDAKQEDDITFVVVKVK